MVATFLMDKLEFYPISRTNATLPFGGPIIKSGDPEEQLKQVKCMDLVANAVMLSNVVDMTAALTGMMADGHVVTEQQVARLSPYLREHIRRFGQYVLDMEEELPPSVLR